MQDRAREPIQILMVDDDPDFLEVARRNLMEKPGIDVLTAVDVEQGLAVLREDDVDCVVSDYRMPDTDGIEFLESVREVDADVPFVLFTGRGSEEIASEAITAGVDDYVLKTGRPDPYEMLANRVQNLVDQARARRSYREMFEKASIGLAVHDVDSGEMIDANRHLYETLGHDPDETADLTLRDVCADEEPYTAGHARETIQSLGESERETLEWRCRSADGETLWVEVTLRRARIGGRDRILAATKDVDERKRRQRRTDRLQQVTRELMTAETDAEIARITARAGAEVLGCPHCGVYLLDETDDTLAGTAIAGDGEEFPRLAALVDDGSATAVDEAVWRAFRDGERTAFVDEDGPLADESLGALLISPLGEHGAFVSAARDPDAVDDLDRSLLDILSANATAALDRAQREAALREREEELERQNERLEEFAGIVSHDLRDPLEAAYGHLELASMECDTEHHEGLREMLTRMQEIVEDALTLARHGQAVVEPEPVDLGEVVDVAWDTAGGGGSTLRTQGSLKTIEGDRTRIVQLLENLFRNAVEHGGEGVTVTVGGFPDGFYVEDDGPGIPKERRDEVFDAGHSTEEGSAGLGLPIVEQIAEAHGWTVSATGGSEGGARFEVTGVDRP